MDANIIDTVKFASDDAPNTRSLKAFADAINSAWRKSAGDFIECGRLLDDANNNFRTTPLMRWSSRNWISSRASRAS